MYRYQRYIYDLTRKYYLLGRDRLIGEMDIRPGETVLEIGCGTGRNLIILAKKHPDTLFFGLDASGAMLETARKKVTARGLDNIEFQTALADNFSFDRTFNLKKPFDIILFSYSISMIPVWREAIENALLNLNSGRALYIVDFYDQRDLPAIFRRLLQSWLRQFHVEYPRELIPYLEELAERHDLGRLEVRPICKSYAFIARFQKTAEIVSPSV